MSDVTYIGPGGRERGRRPLLRMLVGGALRRNRLDQRRTLADVARHARISVPYLSEVERGRKEASSEILAAVCDALRIELLDLLAEVGRDLAKDRAPVARLAVTLAPAILTPATHTSAALTRGEQRPAGGQRHNIAPPARRYGDVVLLAA